MPELSETFSGHVERSSLQRALAPSYVIALVNNLCTLLLVFGVFQGISAGAVSPVFSSKPNIRLRF